MEKKQVEEIRDLIKKEIEKTKKKIKEYKDIAQPVAPDCAIGRVSRMDAINNKSVTDAAIRLQENKLQGLEHQLKRVGDKDFGACAKCGGAIPLQRILLMPHGRFCVKCAR